MGWDTTDVDKYNRQAFLNQFPPDAMWRNIKGAMLQSREEDGELLVSIQGTDHKGEFCQLWIDSKNAMFLMTMLNAMAQGNDLPPQNEPPGETQSHPF